MDSTQSNLQWQQHPYNSAKVRGGLFEYEYHWVEHQAIFAERGYMLRPRYRQNWVPSWLGTGDEDGWSDAEDGIPIEVHTRCCRLDKLP